MRIADIFLVVLASTFVVTAGPSLATTQASSPKPTIAVQSLRCSAGVTSGEADLISDRLRSELFRTDKVDVMEREQMQAIMQEQGFQQSGACSEDGCMVQIGQLLGVQKMVVGSIGKLGKLFMINIRLIDVQTAKVVKVVSVDITGEIENVVDELPGISRQLVDTSSTTRTVAAVARVESHTDPKPQPRSQAEPERSTSKSRLDCKDNVFLEEIPFYPEALGFKVEENDSEDMNSSIKDALDDCYDADVEIATPADLAAAGGSCNARVVRLHIDSLKVVKSPRGSVDIALKVTLLFYRNPAATTTEFQMSFSETGRDDTSSGSLKNAFDDLAESIADDLNFAPYMRKVNSE